MSNPNEYVNRPIKGADGDILPEFSEDVTDLMRRINALESRVMLPPPDAESRFIETLPGMTVQTYKYADPHLSIRVSDLVAEFSVQTAFSDDDFIYILVHDSRNRSTGGDYYRVLIYTSSGEYVRRWGLQGTYTKNYNTVAHNALWVDNGLIYVHCRETPVTQTSTNFRVYNMMGVLQNSYVKQTDFSVYNYIDGEILGVINGGLVHKTRTYISSETGPDYVAYHIHLYSSSGARIRTISLNAVSFYEAETYYAGCVYNKAVDTETTVPVIRIVGESKKLGAFIRDYTATGEVQAEYQVTVCGPSNSFRLDDQTGSLWMLSSSVSPYSGLLPVLLVQREDEIIAFSRNTSVIYGDSLNDPKLGQIRNTTIHTRRSYSSVGGVSGYRVLSIRSQVGTEDIVPYGDTMGRQVKHDNTYLAVGTAPLRAIVTPLRISRFTEYPLATPVLESKYGTYSYLSNGDQKFALRDGLLYVINCPLKNTGGSVFVYDEGPLRLSCVNPVTGRPYGPILHSTTIYPNPSFGIPIDEAQRISIDFYNDEYFLSTPSYIPGSTSQSSVYQIGVYGINGNKKRTLGAYGSGSGQFMLIRDFILYAGDQNIYTIDSVNKRVLVLTRFGEVVRSFGSAGTGDGQFQLPFTISVDSDIVYVADWERRRVLLFTIGGDFLDYARTASGAIYTFPLSRGPYGVSANSGLLYVLNNDGVHKFTAYQGEAPVYNQTRWYGYRRDNEYAIPLGTPDGGVNVPATTALIDVRSETIRNLLANMRGAVYWVAQKYKNPTTNQPYDFAQNSPNNLYYIAMGSRVKYGASGGAKYTWTRAHSQLSNTPMYDIDIGEIAECVRQLEESELVYTG